MISHRVEEHQLSDSNEFPAPFTSRAATPP
jgi:hypothetical protein